MICTWSILMPPNMSLADMQSRALPVLLPDCCLHTIPWHKECFHSIVPGCTLGFDLLLLCLASGPGQFLPWL